MNRYRESDAWTFAMALIAVLTPTVTVARLCGAPWWAVVAAGAALVAVLELGLHPVLLMLWRGMRTLQADAEDLEKTERKAD